MKYLDSKVCKKIAKQSPVNIGFALGVVANMPLIVVLNLIGGAGI